MSEATATIVMATYNGAKWIREQIDSIRSQSLEDWLLLISDDGSTDATQDIILEYVTADERIELLPARTGKNGHVANFEYLLAKAQQEGSRYIFLCDQDDVWEPEKLSRFLTSANSTVSSTLWYSDLKVLDERRLDKSSYFERMGFPQSVTTHLLLGQNTIPGCAMMLSSDLLEVALPFPENLQNHDWWLALCASAKGGTSFVNDPSIQYRQHSQNTIGAGMSIRNLPKLPALIARQRRVWKSKRTAVRELLSRGGEFNNDSEPCLREWLNAFDGAPIHIAAKELTVGQFSPISRSLMVLQLLALLSLSR